MGWPLTLVSGRRGETWKLEKSQNRKSETQTWLSKAKKYLLNVEILSTFGWNFEFLQNLSTHQNSSKIVPPPKKLRLSPTTIWLHSHPHTLSCQQAVMSVCCSLVPVCRNLNLAVWSNRWRVPPTSSTSSTPTLLGLEAVVSPPQMRNEWGQKWKSGKRNEPRRRLPPPSAASGWTRTGGGGFTNRPQPSRKYN